MNLLKMMIPGIGLCIAMSAASGCRSAVGGSDQAPKHATPLGVYPASASMTKKYGIVEWHSYVGKSQMVVTGYKADGTPVRGVQLAWFKSVPGTPGHTRLMMLDGSGATIRHMVDGTKTGHFSAAQVELLTTMRFDLARWKPSATGTSKGASYKSASYGGGKLRTLDDPGGLGSGGTTPGTGPKCTEAWADPSIAVDGVGCAYGAATFETVVGGVVAVLSCAQWYAEAEAAKAKCTAEDAASCNSDTPPTCKFGEPTTPPPAPEQACDKCCLCANYDKSPDGCDGCPGKAGAVCTDNAQCSSGECHFGSCDPPKTDSPSEQNVSTDNKSSPSCDSGDVSADPSTGKVACATPTTDGSGSSSEDAGTGGGTGTGGTDPTDGTGSGSTPGGDPGTCASDGSSCSADSDCCSAACGSGVCGGGTTTSDGGTCASDGASCSADSDCCSGSCASGTCGGGTTPDTGPACSSDGASCSADSDCCSGTCTSGTCGSGSTPDSGPACSSDGTSCSAASDCCSGACTSGVCGTGPACGSAGSSCSADGECCSGSCDSASSTCN